ncbi:thioredoxin family protein [Streptococcus suis]|uniref:hypothetical protein n=1 Tax=Streptococcus suis TaxID=1307 RepID=UPI0038B7E13F
MKKMYSNKLFLTFFIHSILLGGTFLFLSFATIVVSHKVVWSVPYSFPMFLLIVLIFFFFNYLLYSKGFMLSIFKGLLGLYAASFFLFTAGLSFSISDGQSYFGDESVLLYGHQKELIVTDQSRLVTDDTLKNNVLVFFKPNCPYCQLAIPYLLETDNPNLEHVLLVDVSTKSGSQLANKYGITEVPMAYYRTVESSEYIPLSDTDTDGNIIPSLDGFDSVFHFVRMKN